MVLPRNDEIGIGSRVRIKRGTMFAYQNDGIGTVTRVGLDSLRVRWDEEKTGHIRENYYPKEDLKSVT